MALLESGLIGQARTQVQQTTELVRHQKEADQISRQLFADCVETVERYGERVKGQHGLERLLAFGIVTPAALLFRSSPAELLDSTELTRTIDSEGVPLEITLTASLTPRKSPSVSIYLEGVNHRLVLNKYKGYGEVYLNDSSMNEPTQHQGRANIDEVISFRQALESMRDFVKAPTVPIPADVMKYSQMRSEALEEELKRAQRWSGINLTARQFEGIGSVIGLVFSLGGHPELMYGSIGLIILGTFAHGKTEVNLDRKVRIIQDEIASRH